MYTRVLVALALIATLATALPHNFGEVLPCGPIATNYDFGGSSLTIQCSANATFTLSLYVSLQTQFSSTDIKAVTAGVGLSVGFTLAVSPATTAVLQASFVTPSLSATSQLDLQGNFDAGCLQYDSATKSYNQIDIQSYNFTTNAITVNFPEAGTYVLIAFNSNAYLPAWYGRNHTVHSGSTKKLQFPAGLYVELYSQNENVLSVNYSTSNPTQVTPSGAVYDYYWVFKSNTEQNINATLKYVYNKTEAVKNNIDQTNLHWEFYDETSASWKALGSGGSVDVQAGVVLQVTPHFSTWTVSDNANSSSAGFVQVNALLIAVLFVCKLLF